MGGFFSASSRSRSTADSSRQTLQAGDNSNVQLVRGGGKKSTTLGAGAIQVRGGDVIVTQTDGGLVAAAQAAIEAVVKSQADTTSAAIGSLGKLGETRVTGGENLALEGVSKNTLYIVGGVVAVIVAIFFLKR
jgi:hypothetical protein